MKILLIEPNSRFAVKSTLGISGPPLGLAYIAAYLRVHAGCEVKILDALTLNYSQEQVSREIKSFRPDIVGINVMSTPAVYDAYSYARAVKKARPSAFVMVGGQHVTFAHRETLEECPEIDAVVRGEGEVTALDLVKRLSSKSGLGGCSGLTYRENGSIRENPPRAPICDLDSIPYPAYDLLQMEKYSFGKQRFAAIVTSRGCPFECAFCSGSGMGKKYRARSAESIVEELELLVKRYSVSEVEFLDELFTLEPERVKKITGLIRERALKFSWSCSSRAGILTRFPWIAKHLKQAGCHTVCIGAEAGTQSSLKQVKRAVEVLKKEKLRVMANFVLGIPGESKKDAEIIRFTKKLGADQVRFTVCMPFPGTPMYEEAKRKGMVTARNWKDFSIKTFVMKPSNISYDGLRSYILTRPRCFNVSNIPQAYTQASNARSQSPVEMK